MTTATSPATSDGTASRARPAPLAIALVLVLGSIMVTLDQTVVNVAVNRLSQDFAVPLATLQWVITGYSLALGAVIPVTAWAAGRFGAKRLYLLAIVLFGAGSLLAGTAWNIESLIAFRVLQGLGGGMVMPLGMTILLRAAPPDRLGRLMSTLGLAILVGPLAGPVLGGWLVDEVSWRWMFFLNVPIGFLVVLLGLRVFPRDEPGPVRALDVPGLLLLSPGLAALIYGVTSGGERGEFAAPGVWVPLLLGGTLVAAFVLRALTARHPLIDLRLFRRRSFATASGVLTLFATGYFGSMLLLPLYLQVVRGESATAAGLLGAPLALASGTSMQITGRLIDRVGPRRIVVAGAALAACGFALVVAQLSADVPYWRLCAALVLVGLGGGATMMPTMTAASAGMPRDLAPAVSTTVSLVNTTVGAIGTAVASVLLTAAMAARVPAAEGGLQSLHALPPDALAEAAPGLADAFQHTYVWAVVMTALAVVPALLLPRRDEFRRGVSR
ncbi:DHA2 family efflux MFS transporter permease subunit [Actinomadura miaoliensis]|uniref:MFS transporter n=1 Tax=Actinomadura miaoliensis TaxID=430685 RepID=A0ABP7V5X2_9ACTN